MRTSPLTSGLAAAGGRLLGAGTRVLAARPAAKPLHPVGTVRHGLLVRHGSSPGTGAAWLDEPGEDRVLVRASRSLGLPDPLPDVYGLAVRAPAGPGRHGDLLFASTGLGRLTRFAMVPSRSPHAPMTTLLPYRTPTGPVQLAAVLDDDATVTLSWARPQGAWTQFAHLRLDAEPVGPPDVPVSFDPVLHTLPGLDNYEWVRRLREPSYLTARRSRRGDAAPR
jgi:hypothetical protein